MSCFISPLQTSDPFTSALSALTLWLQSFKLTLGDHRQAMCCAGTVIQCFNSSVSWETSCSLKSLLCLHWIILTGFKLHSRHGGWPEWGAKGDLWPMLLHSHAASVTQLLARMTRMALEVLPGLFSQSSWQGKRALCCAQLGVNLEGCNGFHPEHMDMHDFQAQTTKAWMQRLDPEWERTALCLQANSLFTFENYISPNSTNKT